MKLTGQFAPQGHVDSAHTGGFEMSTTFATDIEQERTKQKR